MIELARCHICAALMPDTEEDRRDHVSDHANVKKRLDAMTRSLNYLNGEIEKAHARIEELETQPSGSTDSEGLTINEFPDDEVDDTEPGNGTADPTPVFAEITDENATPEDDLDARIANLSGVAPTVTPA